MLQRIAISFTSDKNAAIRIRKVGTETATSVVTTAATNIVLTGSTTTDTITFSGSIATLGTVVDEINATGRWEAMILDALRSEACDEILIGETAASSYDPAGNVIWDLHLNNSDSISYSVCLSPKNRSFGTFGNARVTLHEYKYYANVSAAAADSVTVVERDGSGETVRFAIASADSAATAQPWDATMSGITADWNNDLVVHIVDAASINDSGAYIWAAGTIEQRGKPDQD